MTFQLSVKVKALALIPLVTFGFFCYSRSQRYIVVPSGWKVESLEYLTVRQAFLPKLLRSSPQLKGLTSFEMDWLLGRPDLLSYYSFKYFEIPVSFGYYCSEPCNGDMTILHIDFKNGLVEKIYCSQMHNQGILRIDEHGSFPPMQ